MVKKLSVKYELESCERENLTKIQRHIIHARSDHNGIKFHVNHYQKKHLVCDYCVVWFEE